MFLEGNTLALEKVRIFVRVKPNARENRVQKLDPAHLVVFIKEPPQENRANEALIKTLASYFSVSQDMITIASGRRSKLKIIYVEEK